MTVVGSSSVDASDLTGSSRPPIVWVNDQRRDDLRLVRLIHTGPTNTCSAQFVMRRTGSAISPEERSRAADLEGQHINAAQPICLDGSEGAMYPLFEGRIVASSSGQSGEYDTVQFDAVCRWADRLSTPVAGSDTLSAAEALSTLAAQVELGLGDDMVRGIDSNRRVGPWGSNTQAASVLEDVLTELGMFIRIDASICDARWAYRRTVVSRFDGRPIRLAIDHDLSASIIEAWRTSRPSPRAARFTGAAAPQVVESTFELRPAWLASDQTAADSQYAKSTSSDFDRYANVFRLWVLNEDGSLDGSPFDLASIFGDQPPIPPRAIPFGTALTYDSAGRSVGVVVELSLDAGLTWHRHSGRLDVLADRAGVYLDDDVLDPAWITSVRADEARVRVTASLTSPEPTEAVRWRGNPFVPGFADERIDLSDRFGWRRIAPDSRFADQVSAGERQADTRDDREALGRWLVEHARRWKPPTSRFTVELPLMLGLMIGDRVSHPTAPGSTDEASVVRVDHDWHRHRTTLELELIGGAA